MDLYGLCPGVWNDRRREEVTAEFTESVPTFPVNVLWVFYFERFSDGCLL
jgi:hypothetical protein